MLRIAFSGWQEPGSIPGASAPEPPAKAGDFGVCGDQVPEEGPCRRVTRESVKHAPHQEFRGGLRRSRLFRAQVRCALREFGKHWAGVNPLACSDKLVSSLPSAVVEDRRLNEDLGAFVIIESLPVRGCGGT